MKNNLLQEVSDIIEQGAYNIPAKDIFNRLNELKNQNEIAKKRWFWELLQNAKDSVADKAKKTVDVELNLQNNHLSFSHNGNAFSLNDAINLIRPDSTKSEDNEKLEGNLTGRFGTGFLATHILSKDITVTGVVHLKKNEYKDFSFTLKRGGINRSEIAASIKNTVLEFNHCLEKNPIKKGYETNKEKDTKFHYSLDSNGFITAKTALEEIEQVIPYVLVFLPQISSIKIKIGQSISTFKVSKSRKKGDLKLWQIEKKKNSTSYFIDIVSISELNTTLAIEFEEKKGNFFFKEIPKNTPLLFCDFPLIGTENFRFPMLINSSDFIPKTERNGIWLQENEENNKSIFEKCIVPLFEKFIDNIEDEKWKETYLIVNIKVPTLEDFDEDWYKECVVDTLREKLLKAKLVDCPNNVRQSLENIYFPYADKKQVVEKIWYFTNLFYTEFVPIKAHIHKWKNVIWSDCYYQNLEEILSDYSKFDSISELALELKSEVSEAKNIINDLIKLVHSENKNLFDTYKILYNQNEVFKLKNEMQVDELPFEKSSELLKNISKMLGKDFRDDLLHNDINIDLKYAIDEEEVADEISRRIKPLLDANYSLEEEAREIILLFLEWLEQNPQKSKELFSEIYKIRDKFYTSALSSEDKTNLIQILKNPNGYSLQEIAEIVSLKNVSNVIKAMQEKEKEKTYFTNLGIKVEEVFKQALSSYKEFKIQQVMYGRDFVIEIEGSKIRYNIELKSISQGSVLMTKYQAQTAVNNSDLYALCVLPKKSNTVSIDFFKKNARFITNIGIVLQEGVKKSAEFENYKSNINHNIKEGNINFEGELETKFRISESTWERGLDFDGFVKFLQKKLR